MKSAKKVVFISSHVIQYFSPLYRRLSEGKFDVEVWYCSEMGYKSYYDSAFSTNVKWKSPLLNGYSYYFFSNFGFNPSGFNFISFFNPKLYLNIFKERNTIFIIPGWQFLTYIIAFFCVKISGNKVVLRFETPFNQFSDKRIQTIKSKFLKFIYFRNTDFFFFIGKRNKKLLQHFEVPSEKLFFSPYCVDNNYFSNQYQILLPLRDSLRSTLGITPQQKVIIYSGKFIAKKNPMDLLKAFHKLDNSDYWLIFVGEGDLRSEMELYIQSHNIQKVILTGFINQDEISNFYVMGDVFVMCSGIGETWGLSVNEAMNFRLPVIVYDVVGCAEDLVDDNRNGKVIEYGNINQLADSIHYMCSDMKLKEEAGNASFEIVSRYSFESVYHGLSAVLSTLSVR